MDALKTAEPGQSSRGKVHSDVRELQWCTRSRQIFAELTGASGAVYRFRVWPDGGQAPIAGNFLVVDRSGPEPKIVIIGVTDDLSQAKALAHGVLTGGRHVYVRLNVSRAMRRQEHDDLAAAHPSAQVLDEESK